MNEPRHLRQGLEQYLRHLGAPPVSVLTELEKRWPDCVGPALAGASRPIDFVDGTLVVSCDDAAWAAQIGWMEAQIIDRFRAMFPDATLSRVTTRVGGTAS
ncbi:MAG: DUF721 domain-containing protein [Acidimicrobiales bacterium]